MCFKFKYFLEFSIFLRNTYRTIYTYYHTTYCTILRNKKKNPVQLVKHYYYFLSFYLYIYLLYLLSTYLSVLFIYLSTGIYLLFIIMYSLFRYGWRWVFRCFSLLCIGNKTINLFLSFSC